MPRPEIDIDAVPQPLVQIPIVEWQELNQRDVINRPQIVEPNPRWWNAEWRVIDGQTYKPKYEKPTEEMKQTKKTVRPEVEKYKDLYNNVLHTGSRVIVAEDDQRENPPKDDDYVLLVPEISNREFLDRIVADGYSLGGSHQDGPDGFNSYRLGEINLIITSNPNFFYDFENATRLAKFLNLKEKKDRVALFKAVRDGIYPEVEL